MDNLVRVFTESSPPLGFTYATGQVTAALPTVNDVKTGSYTSNGWSASGQRRNSYARRSSLSQVNTNASARRPSLGTDLPAINANADINPVDQVSQAPPPAYEDQAINNLETPVAEQPITHDPNTPYPNGYQFPPPHSTLKSLRIGLHSFLKFVLTPLGFLITIYGLNIVAWGGMLFLILVGAAPAMCHPSCSDLNSPAKKWLEITSQILNALFCVTGLGLIPWRFRDLYYLMQYRVQGNEEGIRRLAGLCLGWFRLRGSENIPVDWDPKTATEIPYGVPESAVALPISSNPAPPLTGERAPPSKYWKLDFIIWAYVWNSFLQIALCGIMWGLNRFNRPGWATGLLISLACIVAGAGGFMGFLEGKRVKRIEGVPVSKEDMEILQHMRDEEKVGGSPQEGSAEVKM